jgi:hypothetical protein
MTKGELMNEVFTAEQLKNIDPSIPQELLESGTVKWDESGYYVMDYNGGSVFGELRDMRELKKP